MLALTRKKGESIIIGDDIELVVLSVSGDFVKLGINAPRHIPVHRKEIYLQILEQNKEAAQTAVDKSQISDLVKLMKKND